MNKPAKRGRAVPVYRPGVNRAEEVQIPAVDLTTADGRLMVYRGKGPPQDAGGVLFTVSRWISADGLAMLASLDTLPHLSIKSKPRFLHVSLSRAERYPGWDEMVAAIEALAGPNLDMVMVKPRRSDYVMVHDYCFHWWELPVEWGVQ